MCSKNEHMYLITVTLRTGSVEECFGAAKAGATTPSEALLADEGKWHLLKLCFGEWRCSQRGKPVLITSGMATNAGKVRPKVLRS